MSNAEHLRVIEGEGRGPSQPPPDPLVGRTIDGRYLVERVLGEGGMGLVYKAKHTVLGKQFAIKVLRPDVSKDEEIMARFKQEAQSASAIGNEHIIDISDFGTLPDASTYFVMEFLDGRDLTTAIEKERPLDARRTCKIAKQLCTALGAAHERGIVHRDLKPDNIYLIKRGSDSDFVKVLDFGIAKVSSGGNAKMTRAGQVFGTPHYMSPEQCAGTNVDHRTDIYAIGVILYEMASGRVPFDADNLMGILTKHLYEEPIPPHELPPPVEVPPALEAVILKCLAKSADQRYQSMAEMVADLEKIEQGLTPDAVIQQLERGSQQGREPTGRHGMTVGVGDSTMPKAKSKTVPIVAGVSALLAVCAIVGVVAMTSKPDTTATPPVTPPVTQTPTKVAEPAVPEVAPTTTGSTTSAMVTINSNPPGAELFKEEVLQGNAPLEMDRPTEGNSVTLAFRLPGYQTRFVEISSSSRESVTVNLTPEPAVAAVVPTPPPPDTRRPSSGHHRERPSMVAAPAETEMTAPVMEQRLHSQEVLDPWSNN